MFDNFEKKITSYYKIFLQSGCYVKFSNHREIFWIFNEPPKFFFSTLKGCREQKQI